MPRIAFHQPLIPGNTGNAIRLSAATGFPLHLIGPLGFELTDARLRRAGLDYHDLATVTVHDNLDQAWTPLMPARVFAFTSRGIQSYADIRYQADDVLLFGTETTGLPDEVLTDAHITELVRIPMLAGRRSLNLANSAAIASYEAWRQLDFRGA